MSEFSGRVRGVVNTPTASAASGRWSVRAVAKYVAAGVWPSIPVPGGDYEPIATITAPSGGLAAFEFNNIPDSYRHLQVRFVSRCLANADGVQLRFNGNTSATYAVHRISGNGSSASAAAGANATSTTVGIQAPSSASASVFGVGVLDILDYAETGKLTTVRCFTGYDNNGNGDTHIRSGLWTVTDAVTTMRFFSDSGSFAQHSTYSLYGIRAEVAV